MPEHDGPPPRTRQPDADGPRADAPGSSLSQRMADARERTVAARTERAGAPLALPATAAPLQAGPAALQPSPMMFKSPPRSRPVLASGLPPAGPLAARRTGLAWELPAQPGEQLMLLPGQMHFGGKAASLRTLLGSCVAVTLWHPQRRIGGMCHFLLPSRPRRSNDPQDGKYGDEALDVMVARIRAAGTEPHEYEAHLYGGADTMPEGSGVKFNVGERNIEQGWTLIDRHGFQLQGVDVGEDVPRTVTLHVATGAVDMKRGHGRAPTHVLPPMPALPSAATAGAGKPNTRRT